MVRRERPGEQKAEHGGLHQHERDGHQRREHDEQQRQLAEHADAHEEDLRPAEPHVLAGEDRPERLHIAITTHCRLPSDLAGPLIATV